MCLRLYASVSRRWTCCEFLSSALCSGVWGASDSNELRAGKAVRVQCPGLLSGESDWTVAKTNGQVTRASSFSMWNCGTDHNSEMESCWGRCRPLGLYKILFWLCILFACCMRRYPCKYGMKRLLVDFWGGFSITVNLNWFLLIYPVFWTFGFNFTCALWYLFKAMIFKIKSFS